MGHRCCIVLTTLPDSVQAEAMAEGVLAAGLAACIQMFPVRSLFVWQGELRREEEVVLLIKANESAYGELESLIRDSHCYDLPEIIKLPVTGGLPAYLDWVGVPAGRQGSDPSKPVSEGSCE